MAQTTACSQRILGKLLVSHWPVYQSDEQMSPFTSNFTSDATQAPVHNYKKNRGGSREVWENVIKKVRECLRVAFGLRRQWKEG